MYQNILYQVEDRIASIKLNRPEKRNALNDSIVTELKDAFDMAEKDDNVKVVVLSGEGEAFCAGADLAYLKGLQNNSFDENLADSQHLRGLFEQIYRLDKVVIAKVTGHAIAGGAGLATVCDLVYSVPEALYGYTEVKIGFVPAIVSLFLLRKCGEAVSKDLLLTGRLISAEEAVQKNCFTGIFEASEIDAEVNKIAKKLCSQASGDSLRLTKELIGTVQELALGDGLDFAANMNAKARATKDCKAGIAAFLNKEKLLW